MVQLGPRDVLDEQFIYGFDTSHEDEGAMNFLHKLA